MPSNGLSIRPSVPTRRWAMSEPRPELSMGLKVDREAALAWLGIESYRPSGRAPLPAASISGDAVMAVLTDSASPVAELDQAAGPGLSKPLPAVEPPIEPIEPDQSQPAVVSLDRLLVAADSPHRTLAEAIARVAGLACEMAGETEEGGDILMVAGETWPLSALAGDGRAKRRLWQLLVTRRRRPRT